MDLSSLSSLQHLKTYRYADRVLRDINALLNSTRSFQVRRSKYVLDDGTDAILFELFGTVDMFYRHRVFRVPVSLWLMQDYPSSPPLVFVTPTDNMYISRNHSFVDASGRVLAPMLLFEWSSSFTLIDVTQDLSRIFSIECPIFSHSPESTSLAKTNSDHSVSSSHPLHLSSNFESLSMDSFSSFPPNRSGMIVGSEDGQIPLVFFSPTPESPPSYEETIQRVSFPSSSSSGTSSAVQKDSLSPKISVFRDHSSHTPIVNSSSNFEPKEDESFVADTRTQLIEAINQISSSISNALSHRCELLESQLSLVRDHASSVQNSFLLLQDQEDFLNKAIKMYGDERSNLESWMEQEETLRSIPVDELLDTASDLGKRFLDELSLIQSTQDCINVLQAALGKGTLPLVVFVKHIRRLSRVLYLRKRYLRSLELEISSGNTISSNL